MYCTLQFGIAGVIVLVPVTVTTIDGRVATKPVVYCFGASDLAATVMVQVPDPTAVTGSLEEETASATDDESVISAGTVHTAVLEEVKRSVTDGLRPVSALQQLVDPSQADKVIDSSAAGAPHPLVRERVVEDV